MMRAPTVAMSGLGMSLLESDRVYFELGAQIEHLPGARLAWMPGLQEVAAACVVHRVDGDSLVNPKAFLDDVEQRIIRRGWPTVRIYVDGGSPSLESSLRSRGYKSREEIGYVTNAVATGSERNVRLRPVLTGSDWEAKRAVHEACDVGPDGYRAPARMWVELERRKCEGGAMSTYLIEDGDVVCGTVGMIECYALTRIKNLIIRPELRQRGVATQALHSLREATAGVGMAGLGCFAIRGGAGESLYRSAGLVPVTRQVEWTRSLS